MVADWALARSQGQEAVMLALTHEAVYELNRRARTHRRAHTTPHTIAHTPLGETVAYIEETDTEFAIGDTVVCLRNDRRIGVRNGDIATVAGATDEGLLIDRNGTQIELPTKYLSAGHLDYGYALTVHKAQGATYDVALFYGDEHLYAEAGYVALTRGRDLNRLYVLDEEGSNRHLTAGLARHRLEPAASDLAPPVAM